MTLRRLLLVVLTAAALAVPAQAQIAPISRWVEAPDGTRLATWVTCPDVLCQPSITRQGPWPVVLQRTPYGAGTDGMKKICQGLTLAGYVCVVQDERGTGQSGGTYSGYVHETSDGQATLRWIARQSWCNGKIGTFGASALGMTQYAMAPGAPAELKAQIPIVATADFYNHAVFQGGALRVGLVHTWLSKQGALPVFEELKQHRLWDGFWRSFDVASRVDEVETPALHIGGWYDIFQQGTLDAFAAAQHRGDAGARGRQKLLIGPWTHYGVGLNKAGALSYPINALMYDDFLGIFHDFFDHHLKGQDHGVAGWPNVRVYLMGAVGEAGAPGNRWLDLPDWPPPAAELALHLGSTGTLSRAPAPAAGLELRSDPSDPVPTRGGQELLDDWQDAAASVPGAGPHDQRPIEAREDVLVFSTGTLARPLTVMGRMRVHLWVRPDTPDLDLAVRLTDVYPDGRSMLVADGIQRARMRCGDDRECLLVPGQPVELVVDLWSTAIVFNAGHRIRISVSGSNAPRFEVNPNHGGDLNGGAAPIVARPELLLGPATPSRVVLPVPHAPRRVLPRSSAGTSPPTTRSSAPLRVD